MCGEMSEAHERALCAQAFSRTWDLIPALCRYSQFLDNLRWNFVDFFPQLVLFLLPIVFVWHQAGMAGVAVLAEAAPEAAVSLVLSSRRAAVLSCALWNGLLYSRYLHTFGLLCILVVCSNFVTLVSVSLLSPSILLFATITFFAALINQITNNRVSDVFGFVLQQIVLFFLGFAILGLSQISEFMCSSGWPRTRIWAAQGRLPKMMWIIRVHQALLSFQSCPLVAEWQQRTGGGLSGFKAAVPGFSVIDKNAL